MLGAARVCLVPVLLLVVVGAHGQAPAQELLVAAAADLRYAFEEMGIAFRQRTGVAPTFSLGSSGQLAHQVEHGAPFDIFFSANAEFVERLARGGFVLPETVQLYAIGRIVVWVRRDSPLDPTRGLGVLDDPRVRFVAIANPEHAPYGEAARQALERSGLLPRVRGRLVFGDNVSLTLQLVTSGNADVGIVALSLALAPTVAREGRYWLVPEALHEPLRQATGVVTRSQRQPLARAFLAFVNGDGRPIMRRFGFVLPGEAQ
ncbi:MAG: molybdate ABC transporter substrate-binding protein [Armatimonadota bacterium]|nr:molybdate ABC transporter substrate-binding protein [Armatimonadota bacterium]